MNLSDFPDLGIATAEGLCAVEVFHEPLLVRLLQVTFFQLHDQVDSMRETNGPEVRGAHGIGKIEDFWPSGGDGFADAPAGRKRAQAKGGRKKSLQFGVSHPAGIVIVFIFQAMPCCLFAFSLLVKSFLGAYLSR